MSINLLEKVQENLGYPALQKIDPNTEEMVVDVNTPNEDTFSQAAIPAILISLFKYSESNEGAKDILSNESDGNWVSKIFNNNSQQVVQTIAAYSKQSSEDPIAKMNLIATEAIKIAKDNLKEADTIEDLKTFFNEEKNNTLLYLPSALHLGVITNNNTIDDSTNKMEGPISSLMQSIGSIFSNPTTEKSGEN